ncbi:L-glutamine:D-fructose-6-phosphate aminotransferase [Candidatus Terasakiella magnetica]|uniref:Glutamine--fructose-6-phosphate aminotransferase [isomerizing] n=1 Tax=Candidatus Terasakiella magnetica TaxID=1867952 RepID=A0A1C3RM19_9PROT|nr:glutamine--fructose-6-phosphate transaminase (isomerizing) [Candidatus Terasakiella magnetica]SCA58288.1 L-glutamine:D-fructose-6-phosphate aminotransferase [Candidatus Terasakiella magnetica]
MCGIVGFIGKKEAAPLLVEGLKRLEYRGYDSAGIATLPDGKIERRRAEGKIINLENTLNERPTAGTIGIGHTRWATHGIPNETNAHPHATERVAVVHNGIIENFQELRAELVEKGFTPHSETDSEVVPLLITSYLNEGVSPIEAVKTTLKRLDGAFALGIIFAGEDDLLIGARRGSPLAVGFGEGEMYLGSDAMALAPLTKKIAYLDEGDWVVLKRDQVTFYNEDDQEVSREIRETAMSGALIGKGEHRHYMLKEIFEQPQVIGDTLASFFNPTAQTISMPDFPFDLATIPRITIVACGTSFYAGLVAKYWIEQYARIGVEIDVASEFRYREAPMEKGGLSLFISQSGETADTLAALRYAKSQDQHIMSIVNVPESSMERESHAVLHTHAGPEIGVASTKAFTTQLTVLACFSIALAKAKGAIDPTLEARLCKSIAEVPARVTEILNHDESLRDIAHSVAEARDVLYLGRGASFPIAMEGALKLKEISYIHAEGYAAGEMKHGPIALIDESVPVIVLAPSDSNFEKTASNTQEVVARGGRVIFMADKQGCEKMADHSMASVAMPDVEPFVAPILYSIPVQLLAYHVAVHKGTDVDQPRNLAKSVTVE